MSAADDVVEMQSLCEFIAERLAISNKDKDRTKALYSAFNPEPHRGELITWNRCFEFLKGKARLVQSWEKDLARTQRDAIKAAERERRAREHVEWLQFIHQQATAEGEDMDRAEVAALERVLARIGAQGGALGGSETPRRRSTD
jgi:hypothetical protein